MNQPCTIQAEILRRNGQPKYWCTAHHSPAWAADGTALKRCSRHDRIMPGAGETPEVDPGKFAGGVGIWGSLQPVMNTTTLEPESGVHVHARKATKDAKVIDGTFAAVKVWSENHWIVVSGEAAMAGTVSRILQRDPEPINCSHCGAPHLDEGDFAVRMHRKHECQACGRSFYCKTENIGNPLAVLDDLRSSRTVRPSRILDISQDDFPGGIQIWGSNPALIWTARRAEEVGIHVHCYDRPGRPYGAETIDQTFGKVRIDGIELDDEMVRTLMAQRHLPSLAGRLDVARCAECGHAEFDRGANAIEPRPARRCSSCQALIRAPHGRAIVSNPILEVFERLASNSGAVPRSIERSVAVEV